MVLDVGTGVRIDILALSKLGLACRFIGIDFLGKACWWLRRGSMLIVKARKQNLMRVPK